MKESYASIELGQEAEETMGGCIKDAKLYTTIARKEMRRHREQGAIIQRESNQYLVQIATDTSLQVTTRKEGQAMVNT